MEIVDDALMLSARPFGERDLIVSLLTRGHGRVAGIARAGQAKAHAALWQPGNAVSGRWRARLADQLGAWTAELRAPYAAAAMADAGALAALASACALLDAAVEERDPQPALHDDALALMGAIAAGGWRRAYPRWELALLGRLGFGLDLAACALTGAEDDLAFVSPKTGRAASAAAGAAYADRLLPLPAFLRDGTAPDDAALAAALRLTGHFLERELFTPRARPLPPARGRLAGRLGGGGPAFTKA